MLVRLKKNKSTCRNRILKRDSIERGKNKILNLNEFNNGWWLYKKKEEKYRSKLIRAITLKNDLDLSFLLKKLSK